MVINNYLNKFKFFAQQGKGFSIYNCDTNTKKLIIEKLKNTGNNLYCFKTSEIAQSPDPKAYAGLVVIQDLDIDELLENIEEFINKYIFPFYFDYKPIYFLSGINKTNYRVDIDTGLLHTNYQKIVNLLLLEQFDRLIEQVNLVFTSPAFLNRKEETQIFTPIEQIMYRALIDAKIEFEPQVRIDRFMVDFLVNLNNRKIIVECDGRDYHNPNKDRERDKELRRSGYEIIHFTGSEIYHDAESCVNKIVSFTHSIPKKKYEIDRNLDESQRIALQHISGPMRVLAPAGSGKTKTLINRIVYLINQGIEPEKIIALAFNKRAEQEMIQRLNKEKGVPIAYRLGEPGCSIRTFHSFGYEIIRNHLNWQFNGKTVEKLTRKLLRQAVENHYQIPPRRNVDPLEKFLEALRQTKMELPPVDQVTIEDEDRVIPFGPIFYDYLDLQKEQNFLNFDDMIYLALRILLKENELRKKVQEQFEYVLIDEFQDLNKAQILLMQILALPQNNLFIVGDDDQMIYGWRGAEITHILNFPERYPVAKDCTLSTNYRSSKRIVNHSKWLIDQNQNRVPKDIKPSQDRSVGQIDIALMPTLWDQAREAVKWIKKQKEEQQCAWKDFAVLFRYNSYQFIVAMILDSEKIPHTPIDGKRLFQTNVGKDIFSYLRIILYENDATKEDFARILKRPNRYLSNKIIDKITNYESLEYSPQMEWLEQWQREKLQSVVDKISKLKESLKTTLNKSHQIVQAIAYEFDLHKFYQDQSKIASTVDEAGDDVLLEVIINVARQFPDIKEFFGHVYQSIYGERDDGLPEEENRNEVVLSTIHRTKGNEFSNVVYFNLAQNDKIKQDSEIEEERRVCYVGITRAIKNLLITAPEDHYSIFLPEIILNPNLKEYSLIELNHLLQRNKRQKNIYEEEQKKLNQKIFATINKYPELDGKYVPISGGLFKNFRYKIREKKVNKALEKIKDLESEISDIRSKKILPAIDMIEQIEIEKKFRQILKNDEEEL